MPRWLNYACALPATKGAVKLHLLLDIRGFPVTPSSPKAGCTKMIFPKAIIFHPMRVRRRKLSLKAIALWLLAEPIREQKVQFPA